ncbi:MAG: trigger factor [Ruminococcaceae bacterium]|nr:trigger factor [Oscillospiraceae bacterium]
MSTVLAKKENGVAEFTLTIAAAEFDSALDNSFKKNVKKITVPGFRKGKAPRKLIEKTYGEGVFYEDAIDMVFPKAYEEAVKELDLIPVDSPSVDIKEIGQGKDLVIEVKVTLKPEFELSEYKGIKLKEIVHNVSDEDVDADLLQKQERSSRLVSVEDRAVMPGDVANINFEGFADGVAFPGGKGENFDLTIGSGQFIPGFEEQIVGKNIDEEFDVNVTFPEEYHAEELKGKPAVFKVKVNSIQYKELPELDDEFAKDVSEFDTLDELKADIRAKLEAKALENTKTEKENAVMDALIEATEILVPDCMIESRINDIIRENNMRMQSQGISFEQYLGYMGMNIDQYKEMMKPQAQKQIKGNLILEKVIEAEAFEISDEKYEEKLKSMAEQYGMEVEKIKELLGNNADAIKEDMKFEIAIEFLVENAKWSKPRKPRTTKPKEETVKEETEE